MAYISKITPLGSSESYDIRAAALGSSTVGSSNTAIYLNNGTPTACYTPVSGNFFRGIPQVSSDGVMEIGKYIDFHSTNAATTDYDVRLTATTQLTSSATIEATGLLKTTNNSNTTTIGSQNANFCHIYNSANIPFIFNNTVETTTGDLGTASYPWNNLYMGTANGSGIYYKGTKATYRMIRFIDNTNDNYGNGISIGGGGQTIIGGGESADTAAAQAGTAGGEIMQVCNDGNVELIANLQNGWDNRKVLTLNTSGYLMCPSYINVPTGNNENPTLSQFIVTNGSDHYYRKASAAHAMAAIRSNASGSWGISITGNAATATTATKANGLVDGSSTMTSAYNKAGLAYADYSWLAGWNGYELRAVNKSQFAQASHSHAYLPLAGGTMNDERAITFQITRKKNGGGGWAYSPIRMVGNDNAEFAGIGVYGGANTMTYMYIGANAYNGNNLYIYPDGHIWATKVYGAVWNDYAEYRKDNPNEIQEPGRCVKELGNGALALTTKRLERGCEIISDTFGFAIGQDEENGYNTPIASNGRVLAYPYESIEEFASYIGWPVCSGPNGTVSIMTEEEEEKYPSRIIGTISEIPTYEEWGTGKVKVDGRIWIRIK